MAPAAAWCWAWAWPGSSGWGRPWAYWLVVLGSLASLIGFAVFLAPVEHTYRLASAWKVKMVADACFGVVMLVGLSRPRVRAFFRT